MYSKYPKKSHELSRKSFGLLLISILAIMLIVWAVYPQGPVSDSTYYPGTQVQGVTCIIFREVNTYYSFSGDSGAPLYSGTNASEVIQATFDAMTEGGTVLFRVGHYELNSYGLQINYSFLPFKIVGEGASTRDYPSWSYEHVVWWDYSGSGDVLSFKDLPTYVHGRASFHMEGINVYIDDSATCDHILRLEYINNFVIERVYFLTATAGYTSVGLGVYNSNGNVPFVLRDVALGGAGMQTGVIANETGHFRMYNVAVGAYNDTGILVRTQLEIFGCHLGTSSNFARYGVLANATGVTNRERYGCIVQMHSMYDETTGKPNYYSFCSEGSTAMIKVYGSFSSIYHSNVYQEINGGRVVFIESQHKVNLNNDPPNLWFKSWFYDDFYGSAVNSDVWTQTGSGSGTIQDGAPNGVLRLTTGATSSDYRTLNWNGIDSLNATSGYTVDLRLQLVDLSTLDVMVYPFYQDATHYIRLFYREPESSYFVLWCANGGAPVGADVISADTDPHDFKFVIQNGYVDVYADGELEHTRADANVPTGMGEFQIHLITDENSAKNVDVDYVSIVQGRGNIP